jgi:hypothetical protein
MSGAKTSSAGAVVQATFTVPEVKGGREVEQEGSTPLMMHTYSYAPGDAAPPTSERTVEYTGKHDRGDLPAMREGGPYEDLIVGLEGLQAESDKFLTDVIARDKASQGKGT